MFIRFIFHGRLLSFERVYKDLKAIEDLSDTEFLIRIVILTQKPKSILTQTEKDILNQMKILASKLPNTINKGGGIAHETEIFTENNGTLRMMAYPELPLIALGFKRSLQKLSRETSEPSL